MAGCCERCNELSGSIRYEEFVDKLRHCWFLIETSAAYGVRLANGEKMF